jgi:hypothetical protein
MVHTIWSASLSGERRHWCYALAFVLLFAGCRSNSPPPATTSKDVVIWKTVGSWSGRGNRQTETFTSDTGGFRVRWATKNAARPGAGHLHVIFRSGDSGREIIDAVDEPHVGSDSDVKEVSAERPRWYYLTIDSSEVDWTVSVDERVDARVKGSP